MIASEGLNPYVFATFKSKRINSWKGNLLSICLSKCGPKNSRLCSLGSLLEMQSPRPHTILPRQNLHWNKIPTWSACTSQCWPCKDLMLQAVRALFFKITLTLKSRNPLKHKSYKTNCFLSKYRWGGWWGEGKKNTKGNCGTSLC